MVDPVQSCNFKKSTSIFHTSVFNVYFHNLKKILNLGLDPLPISHQVYSNIVEVTGQI